ncbi:unnamed protein product [Prorocentrum cordatum]|uniref:Uncharacterized protein n=1 Tax=Prorocentrum cordatum TaxID=2364126 RepID=A0ABN9VCC5_9DINO|nr:unnamed protein product [Polarella glacialis]
MNLRTSMAQHLFALSWAHVIDSSSMQTSRMLLQLGADFNIPCFSGSTPLEWFVLNLGTVRSEHRHVLLPFDDAILNELLDAGANADGLLGTAAMNRYDTVVQEMLRHGADPNFTTLWFESRETALETMLRNTGAFFVGHHWDPKLT